jgi:hypothetical protein
MEAGLSTAKAARQVVGSNVSVLEWQLILKKSSKGIRMRFGRSGELRAKILFHPGTWKRRAVLPIGSSHF